MKTIVKLIYLSLLIQSFIIEPVIAQNKPKRVAILELNAQNVPNPYAQIIRDILEVKLQKTRLFDVLERNQMKLIMDEQKFQMTDCSDTVCAVQIGKILYADYVIVGSLSKISKYTLTLKIVDIKNGSILLADSESAESENELEKAANTSIERIVQDIQKKNYGTTILTNQSTNNNFHNNFLFVSVKRGQITNFEMPYISLSNASILAYTKTDEEVNEIQVALLHPLNTFFSIKPFVKFNSQSTDEQKTISQYIFLPASNASVNLVCDIESFKYYSASAGLSVVIGFVVNNLQPYLTFGIGYSSYWNKFATKNINISYYSYDNLRTEAYQIYEMTFRERSNVLFTEIEAGINWFINPNIGLSLSGIFNYTFYGNILRDLNINTREESGDRNLIPSQYRDLAGKINTDKFNNKSLAPIWYLQLGVTYRL